MSEQQNETQPTQPTQSDPGYETLTVAGRHVPDANGGPFKSIQDAQAAGHDTVNPTTGTYQIGVVKESHFVPIIEDAAARFVHFLEAAKQRAEGN